MSCIHHGLNQSTEAATNSSSASLIPEPEALRIARTVLFSLIAALALVGNYVVCRAVWRNPGPKPTAHYLVSNLAFAEIISMVCLVFTFHAYEPPYIWKLGHVMCKILEPLQIASLLVITTTLAILAVYRCVLLIKPMVRKPTRRQACCVILVSWMGSAGVSLPGGHFRVVNSYGYDCQIYCEEVFPEGLKHYQNVYTVVLFVINFAVPFAIMTVSYSFVSKKIREHLFVIQRHRDQQRSAALKSSLVVTSRCVKKQIVAPEKQEAMKCVKMVIKGNTGMMEEKPRMKKHLKQNDMDRGIGPPGEHNKLQEKGMNLELENDILKMVYALILIFGVCYIPYQIQFLLYEFKVKAFEVWPHRYTLSRIVFTLACLPSALHPLFYGMMSKFYRKALIKIFSCE